MKTKRHKKNPKKAFPGEQTGFEINKNRKHVEIKSWCKTPTQAEERTTWFYKQKVVHTKILKFSLNVSFGA